MRLKRDGDLPASGASTPGGVLPSESEILRGIQEIARDHLSLEIEPVSHLSLIEDLSLDSIQLLTLAVEVENHFRVCLDPERDKELRTLEDLVRAVRSQLEAPA